VAVGPMAPRCRDQGRENAVPGGHHGTHRDRSRWA
jgi:hypothetical protein